MQKLETVKNNTEAVILGLSEGLVKGTPDKTADAVKHLTSLVDQSLELLKDNKQALSSKVVKLSLSFNMKLKDILDLASTLADDQSKVSDISAKIDAKNKEENERITKKMELENDVAQTRKELVTLSEQVRSLTAQFNQADREVQKLEEAKA